jgi:uncharacterized membrane protein YciS (DUF1049 family)
MPRRGKQHVIYFLLAVTKVPLHLGAAVSATVLFRYLISDTDYSSDSAGIYARLPGLLLAS